MNMPDSSPRLELRERLRGLRLARGLSQAELGILLGVNQKRVARIEAAPDLASLGQIQRLVILLGGGIDIVDLQSADSGPVRASLQQGRGRPSVQNGAGQLSSKRSLSTRAGGVPAPLEEESQASSGATWSATWD